MYHKWIIVGIVFSQAYLLDMALYGRTLGETILSNGNVECAWCKETKPVSETTWFMPEPGENSVRLCDFCYENAAKQVKLHRLARMKGDFPIEAAA